MWLVSEPIFEPRPSPYEMRMLTTTNFDPYFLNKRFQKQAPRAKVESLTLLLHMQKVPFQVGKAAVLTKVFCGVSSYTSSKCQDSTPKLNQDCFLPRHPSGRLVWNAHSDTKHKIEFSSVRCGRFGINSVALVRTRTIPTERPPPVGEVSANFCG